MVWSYLVCGVGLPPCFLSSYLAEFANLPYKHHKYAIHPPILVCLNWSVSITVPDIDMRFSSNDTLTGSSIPWSLLPVDWHDSVVYGLSAD
jgi:hypothetical protein